METGLTGMYSEHIKNLCADGLGGQPFIIATNRGPVEHHTGTDGKIEARRGSGGIVTALGSLSRLTEFTWVVSAIGDGDRQIAESHGGLGVQLPGIESGIRLKYVTTPRKVYHKYYNVISNPLLWFHQHYVWNSPYGPNVNSDIHNAWAEGYVEVNKAFAKSIVDEIRSISDSDSPVVMIHDYHLYLVAGYVKSEIPSSRISHFVHIPWPSARYWKFLPTYITKAICQSLCSANIVGFQTYNDVLSFLHTCYEFLPGIRVDYDKSLIHIDGRQVAVRSYPISIDVDEIRSMAISKHAMDYESYIRNICKQYAIVRVDRAEPSKNILRGFRAYALLLSKHKELLGKVTFLAFLVPSRSHIRQYKKYMDDIKQIIDDINNTYGNQDWKPIETFYDNNYTQALAGLKIYDVLLVNSVIEGMNLISKQGAVVNANCGVIILSETTGAYSELHPAVLGISPSDIEGTMQAMYQALTMSLEERESKSVAVSKIVERDDIYRWLYTQLDDIKSV